MIQRIVADFPPIYDELCAAFKGLAANRRAFFSFGPVIYNPHSVAIAPHLIEHENTHGRRQGVDSAEVLAWWRRYMADPKFRLAEELPAHVAEYRWLLDHGNREQRRAAASSVAERLSSPFYGRLIGRSAALHMLRSARA
jgi:hypothetical protein